MADKITNTRLICEGGLDTTENHLKLSLEKPGCATRLVNYEVGLTGGYRRVNGYTYYDAAYSTVDSAGAEGQILGIIMYENMSTGAVSIIAARKTLSTNAYKLYLYTSGVGWTTIVTGFTRLYTDGTETVAKLRWDVGSDGVTSTLAIVDGVNPALIYNGTTWAEVNSGATGANIANAGGDQAIDAPNVVSFFYKHLFVGRDTLNNKKGILSHSAPFEYFDFTAAGGGGQVIPGFGVIQIKPFRNELFIFGKTAIKKVYVSTTTFVLDDVTTKLGCMAADSVIEIGGDLIFLGPDGFRPISGTDKIGDIELETISKPIQELLKNRLINIDTIYDVNSVVIHGKSQFRLFLSNDQLDVADNKGIIGGLRNPDQQLGWEFGELLGFRCTCATSKYVDGVEIVLHGDYDGKVYKQESGNDLNGSPMLSIYSTPYLDLGDTEFRKVIRALRIFLKGEGPMVLTLGLDLDWGDEDIPNPAGYNISVAELPIEYGDGHEYGDGSVYGGILSPILYQNVEGSFLSCRFTFSAYGTEYPHSLHGMIMRHTIEGQR